MPMFTRNTQGSATRWFTTRCALQAAAAIAFAGAAPAAAQSTSTSPLAPPPVGMTKREPSLHALVGATVHIRPGEKIDRAIVILDGDTIVSVEPDTDEARAEIPPGARVHDLAGHHIYPGFIEPYVTASAPTPDQARPGAHWNARVTPDRSVLDGPGLSSADREALRKLGFTVAHIAPSSGIFSGSTAVVSLAEPESDPSDRSSPVFQLDFASQVITFETGGRRGAGSDPNAAYPASHMGAVALIRQSLSDAFSDHTPPESRASCLAHLRRDTAYFFDADHELKIFTAHEIATEFEIPFAVVGNGAEYKWIDAIAERDINMIVPLVFPSAPDVSSLGKADSVELETMLSWEQAPTNTRRLHEAGVTMAITSSKNPRGLGGRGAFLKNLRKAVEHGLPEDEALALITTNPAAMLSLSELLGAVEVQRRANLVVTDGPLFKSDTRIMDVWIDGRPHTITRPEPKGADGKWEIDIVDMDTGTAVLAIDTKKKSVSLQQPPPEGFDADAEPEKPWKGSKLQVASDPAGLRVSFVIEEPETKIDETVLIGSAIIDGDTMTGVFLYRDRRMSFVGTRAVEAPDDDPKDKADDKADDNAEDKNAGKPADDPANDKADDKAKSPEDLPPQDMGGYPFGPYAMPEQPAARSAVFTNGTIWTQGPLGVIESGVVYINDGRIAWVGTADDWQDFLARVRFERMPEEIDLEGRHLTPGIIDAHSHTGLFRFGVNEGTQAVTSEVRIADAVDPSHINWYRQLASGVTAVNSLHGSANPIGGQSQIHKVRWGVRDPHAMRMEGAKPGIKFALGENVKQSNWGDQYRTRYPQTRMGVETIIRDRFHAAMLYAENPFPRDLELEPLVEILNGERLIHCHSYRQDEILMLCRVAEDFGFRIGTFQHGLEVYKVAEVVREHAIGASIFSDWWSFKVEVQDAIPHAGPLLDELDLLTSYNSDSDELARRMHTEAAKAVKYAQGAFEEQAALAFITINPAIQLGIAERVGSIETGKDADLVVWSGHPLETYTRCEQTWIDGALYYSIERDTEMRDRIASQRARLIHKLLASPRKPKPEGESDKPEEAGDDKPEITDPELIAVRAAVRERFLDALNSGKDPLHASCGTCGVSDWHSLLLIHNHNHHGACEHTSCDHDH